jgi:hypothetical protein
MVGALVMSRAVGLADPALSGEVIAAAAKELKASATGAAAR